MTATIKQRIQKLLEQDPLHAMLCDTPLEKLLYSDSYLTEIVEKKFYSTPEVAKWFGVSDAQLRYYIKPFEEYLFMNQNDTPSTPSAIRLNFLSILKLRMILLLKDEYRVKGIAQIIENNINDSTISSVSVSVIEETAASVHPAEEIEILSEALYQVLNTGLFDVQMKDEKTQVKLNTDMIVKLFESSLPAMLGENTIEEVQNSTAQLAKENESLKQEVEELKERLDSQLNRTTQLQERHSETRLISRLRTEGIDEFATLRKYGFLKKLFYSTQIEKEKEAFIAEYIDEQLYKTLQIEQTSVEDQLVEPISSTTL